MPGSDTQTAVAIETDAVLAALGRDAACRVASFEHFAEIASTNRHLLERAPPAQGSANVALAEFQTAGRGRRGRRWLMPPGSGVALSVAWCFHSAPAGLSAFSLAAGAAARRAIRDATSVEAGLKWPNDLIVDGGKLGGILVELEGLVTGACHVVAGIGINVCVPDEILGELSDLGARDLAGALGGQAIDRGMLAAALIEQLIGLFSGFAASGFGPYLDEWLDANVLDGRPVRVDGPTGTTHGVVRGIADDGALIVESEAGRIERIIAGDVSVRRV